MTMTDRELMQMALDALEQYPIRVWGAEAKKHLQVRLAQPEPESQEAIAKWIKANTEHREWYICPKCSHQTPRWKDEWVGLTDEERTFLAWESNNGPECVAMTEAKLKEKNSG